jgi:hypothetical protein
MREGLNKNPFACLLQKIVMKSLTCLSLAGHAQKFFKKMLIS